MATLWWPGVVGAIAIGPIDTRHTSNESVPPTRAGHIIEANLIETVPKFRSRQTERLSWENELV